MQLPLGDDVPSDDLYDAIVLYGTATVSPGAASGPNTAALANPHGLPMEIHEVRVRITPLSDSTNNFGTLTGQSIAMKFDMGAIAISDSHVPVSATSNFREFLNLSGGQFSQSNPNIIAGSAEYQWRLKYPLFVPTGAVLTPVFTHLGQNSFPVVVDVMYFGRNLPPTYKPPAQVMIPWLSAWNSQSYDNVEDTPASGETSSELDIINPFSTPLEIARLAGGATILSSGSTPTANIDLEDHVFRLATVSIRGSRGDELVRTPTVWNTLFPADWFAWDIPGGWILRPGEFYKIVLRVAAVDYTPDPTTDAQGVGRVQFSIGAVGYRPIDSRTVMTQALEAATS